MELKKIDPNSIDWNKYERVDNNQESFLKQAGQVAGGAITQLAKAPFALAELPSNIVGAITGRKPASKPVSERIQNLGTQAFGNIEPESIANKALQYTAGNWPLLLFGGGPTLGKVGADVAGSLGLATAEKVTDNPLVGIGAHILGQKGFNKASNWIKGIKKIEPDKIGQYINDLYAQEKSLGSKIPAQKYTSNIYKKLDEVNHEVHREYLNPGKFDEAARNRVLTNLNNAEKSLSNPNITLADLSEEKRRLNSAYAYKGSTENQYYQKIRQAFKGELDELSNKYGKWGNAYKISDELYSIDKWQPNLARSIEDLTSKGKLGSFVSNPLAQASLGLMVGAYKGTPYGIATAAAPHALKAASKVGTETIRAGSFLKSLGKSSDGRRLLMDIVTDSAKDNQGALLKNMHKFNKKAEKWEKDNPMRHKINPSSIDWSKYERL